MAVVLAASASFIAVAVLLMVNYLRAIPRELFDAMSVDGAGEWTVFLRLVWPMARPVLGVVSIFAGLGAWNNFLLPLILTQSNANSVLPVGLYKVASTSQYGIDVPVVMGGGPALGAASRAPLLRVTSPVRARARWFCNTLTVDPG